MRMTVEAVEALPEDVQAEIRSHLRAFNECNVVFEYGKFHVGGGTCIKAVYGPDHKFYGIVYAADIYTPEERICNYVEAFHDYPAQYKGNRNYPMLKWLGMMRRDGHELPIRLINGTAMPPALGRVCRRCKSPVWLSETEGYVYQCFECDEDLYEFETEPKIMVEGTKEDPGYVDPGYCDEYCPHCEGETFGIPNNRVSLCAHCGAELFPCATCDEGCDWSQEDLKCHRFDHTEEWKEKAIERGQ